MIFYKNKEIYLENSTKSNTKTPQKSLKTLLNKLKRGMKLTIINTMTYMYLVWTRALVGAPSEASRAGTGEGLVGRL